MEPKKTTSLSRRWNKLKLNWQSRTSKMSKSYKNKILAVVLFIALIIVYFISASGFANNFSSKGLPATHGLFQYELKSSSPLIFPPIEHQPTLKKMGYKNLFLRASENSDFFVKTTSKPLNDKQRKQLSANPADKNEYVKRVFLDHGKTVYRKNNQPEVVIVSLIDYENYSLDSTVQVVQNRIDYAQAHHYGTYIRWSQEFIPFLENQNLEKAYEYMKPLVMRAAMNAFPKAKYFWFVDKNSLIMRMDLSLQSHILDQKVLESSILKGVNIDSDAVIRTHKSIDPSASIIIPQHSTDSKTFTLDFNSFILGNDLPSHALLDYLNDPLFRNYRWSSFAEFVSHLLQWHPFLLRKTVLIEPTKIASIHDEVANVFEKAAETEKRNNYYAPGDMVIQFENCLKAKSCGPLLKEFYEKVTKK